MKSEAIEKLISNIKYPNRLLNGLDNISMEELSACLKGDLVYFLGLLLSTDCNLNCVYCGISDRRLKDRGKSLTASEYCNIINQAGNIGSRSVLLGANGEPLFTKGLPDIIESIKKINNIPVIFTNATILGNDDLCKKIHGIDGIQLLKILDNAHASLIISCESCKRDIYNQVVGCNYYDYFQTALKRIKNESDFTQAKTHNGKMLCRLAFSTVVMPINYSERYLLKETIHKLNGLIVLKLPSLHGSAEINRDKMYSIEESQKIREEIEKITDKKATLQVLSMGCGSWALGISVNDNGEFMTCMTDDQNPYNLNIRNSELSDIIVKRKALKQSINTVCPIKDKHYRVNK